MTTTTAPPLTRTASTDIEEEQEQTQPPNPETQPATMMVVKRSGEKEPADVSKIVKAIEHHAAGLAGVEPVRVAKQTINSLCDGTTTQELDQLSIRSAAGLLSEEPNYSKLAARMLATFIAKETRNQNIHSFSQSVKAGLSHGLISTQTAAFVAANARKLDDAVDHSRDREFEFFGLRIVYDRYLLRHPITREVLETPQYFLLRVACGLSEFAVDAIRFYDMMSSLSYLPSSPTLFNSGTAHPQMSSCYLLDSPEDDLKAIYGRYTDIALLSKHAGGIGLSYSRVRCDGSLIRGTNGVSNGIVPWLKTLDSSVSAVNQGGRRKGAACVYLESWHADVEEFLELRDNTGDESRRAHNLNLANWVPDLFMERVEKNEPWSLFDPKKVPDFPDLHSEDFRKAYTAAEKEGLAEKTIPAQDLYSRMMRTLGETGNGWMCFKDSANSKSNQTAGEDIVHLSNLCTEILEVTTPQEIAVCNLGSLNAAKFVEDGQVLYSRIAETVREVVPFLDKVVDINFYPVESAERSNLKWRPIGIGLMGLQDVFFQLGLPFDSPEAREISRRISEEIYFAALSASCDLAEIHGPHDSFAETRAAAGMLQFDLWEGETELSSPGRWDELKERIRSKGLRNSLMVAIAPTATIASIAGCYECIEPQVSNLFKRETLSGEFLQVNFYLLRKLQSLGLWDENMKNELMKTEGSVQELDGVPDDVKEVFRTAWEIPMRSLIDMAAERGRFIDQSQSLNLFIKNPNIPKLSSMYLHAWKSGLKTTYYLRSRAATRINQTTVAQSNGTTADSEAVCSLENPESCEACQ